MGAYLNGAGLRSALIATMAVIAGVLSLIAAPPAAADPRGVFLCVENASSGPLRLLMASSNDTNAPGPNVLEPGASRCAESTPQAVINIRPGDEPAATRGVGVWSWRVEATRESVAIRTGAILDGSWATWRTPVNWRGIGVNETRRATVPALPKSNDPDWKFTITRFPNNENVGGGADTSGNQWIRYLLTVKERS